MKKLCKGFAILLAGFTLNSALAFAEETPETAVAPATEESSDQPAEKEHLELGKTPVTFTITGRVGLKITQVPQLSFSLKKSDTLVNGTRSGQGQLVSNGNLVVTDETRSQTGWTIQSQLTVGRHGFTRPDYQHKTLHLNLNLTTADTRVEGQVTDFISTDNAATPVALVAKTATGYNDPIQAKVDSTFSLAESSFAELTENNATKNSDRVHFRILWDLVTDPT